MKDNTSFLPLSAMKPENHLFGFAVWKMLQSDAEMQFVTNQLGSRDYQQEKSQVIVAQWGDSLAETALPPNWFRYSVEVELDHEQPFEALKCELKGVTSVVRHQNEPGFPRATDRSGTATS